MQHTYSATLPNGKTITKKSTKPLSHVVTGISSHSKNWYEISWVEASKNAQQTVQNKIKSQGDWYTQIQAIECVQLADKVKENVAQHTCQLCGRAIHDNQLNREGERKIAKHGYERKWSQEVHTCTGSHHLAYEYSCDLIPAEIEMYRQMIAKKQTYVNSLTTNPPATMEYSYLSGRGVNQKMETKVYNKPDGFTVDGVNYASTYSDYASHFRSTVRRVNVEIKFATDDMNLLIKRLADWKPYVEDQE